MIKIILLAFFFSSSLFAVTTDDFLKVTTLSNKSLSTAISDGTINTRVVVQEAVAGTVNESNVTFTVTYTPYSAGTFHLYSNGLLLTYTDDYTRSGTTITMTTAPKYGQNLRAIYEK